VVNDEMGESGLQFHVCHILVDLLRYYFECLRRPMLVSGNQFFYWQPDDPQAGIAPDVYVVADEETPVDEVESWKLWEHGGKGPCLAIEVVADDAEQARKDYAPEMLQKYEALGVREVFRYDPHCGTPRRRILAQRRQLLTHFVRDEQGRLREQPLAHPQRARSVQFDFWLVHVPRRTLRLGTGPDGLALWPTRAETEARRAEEEARRAEEALQALREAEEREAALRAELERLRAQR
jgi:Uma2 family endonuclease